MADSSKKGDVGRREFLQTSAAATAAGYWVAGGVSAQDSNSANERIQFACVGVGGKGESDSRDASAFGDVVAICDVDEQKMGRSVRKNDRLKDAKRYYDFREMLAEMGDKVDAVTVSTPDHTHAPAAAMAMKMKKHCFVQKPLTHSIHEARELGKLAKTHGVATMMGNQGTANPGLRQAAEIVQTGGLGVVGEVHVWTNRPVWVQGVPRPTEKMTPPKTLHWDSFLGPAPYRDYHTRYHPFHWRGWWDFGTGALGDMACHTMNMPFMALDLRDPLSVEGLSSGHNKDSYPLRSQIKYEFGPRGDRGPVTLYWYDGGAMPPASLLQGNKASSSGCLLVGEKGSLYSPNDYGATYVLLGDGMKGYKKPEPTIPRSPGHFKEFVRAIQGGDPAMSNFADYAGPLTETVLLGNLSVYEGGKVEWDAQNLKAMTDGKHDTRFDTLIKHEYREGYTL